MTSDNSPSRAFTGVQASRLPIADAPQRERVSSTLQELSPNRVSAASHIVPNIHIYIYINLYINSICSYIYIHIYISLIQKVSHYVRRLEVTLFHPRQAIRQSRQRQQPVGQPTHGTSATSTRAKRSSYNSHSKRLKPRCENTLANDVQSFILAPNPSRDKLRLLGAGDTLS